MQLDPQRLRNRCRDLSPIQALVHFVFLCRLGCLVRIRLNFDILNCLRITAPSRNDGPRAGLMCGAELNPDVIQNLTDIGTVSDQRNLAHRTTAVCAQQRGHLVDTGD